MTCENEQYFDISYDMYIDVSDTESFFEDNSEFNKNIYVFDESDFEHVEPNEKNCNSLPKIDKSDKLIYHGSKITLKQFEWSF